MKTLTLKRNEMHTGNLILVNTQHPLTSDHKIERILVDENHPHILMERGAATVLSQILKAIDGENEIVPVSGYRSREAQKQIYDDSLKENGQAFTQKYVALPQCSEHQTGYAIDLALKKEAIDYICPDFPYEGICNQFRKIAPKYGFMERYLKGKEAITGIGHEPWHFRYVGYPHSEIMHEKGLTLEAYTAMMTRYPYNGPHYKTTGGKVAIEIFYVPMRSNQTVTLTIPEHDLYQVSGNNRDGFIITLWRRQDA